MRLYRISIEICVQNVSGRLVKRAPQQIDFCLPVMHETSNNSECHRWSKHKEKTTVLAWLLGKTWRAFASFTRLYPKRLRHPRKTYLTFHEEKIRFQAYFGKGTYRAILNMYLIVIHTFPSLYHTIFGHLTPPSVSVETASTTQVRFRALWCSTCLAESLKMAIRGAEIRIGS